ncbi:MAG: lysoplasmalogenase [Chloroflexi bacterium]|nr:lysoplasmalogenase [Chloroflexota bacterium]
MFPNHLPPSHRYLLTGLLILWALLLFGGFVLGRPSGEPLRRMPLWTRIASSLVLMIAAWLWALVARGTPAQHFGQWLALGMTFGLLGDLSMAGLLPWGQRVLGGIAMFGLGHVFYLTALMGFGNGQGLDQPGIRWGAWCVWLLIGLAGWYVIVFRGQTPTFLHWAALPYALLLASTAGLASGLALQAPLFAPMAVGAALFLLSDLILAGGLFSGLKFPLIDDVVWLTYGPGQMLIVYAIGSALRFLQTAP